MGHFRSAPRQPKGPSLLSIQLVEANDQLTEARGQGRLFAHQQEAQPLSYFFANGLIVSWIKRHGHRSDQAQGDESSDLDQDSAAHSSGRDKHLAQRWELHGGTSSLEPHT
jgi:hypothetical protein